MHLAANRPSHLDLPSAARNALAAVLAAFLLGSALSGSVLAQDTESKPSGIPEKELNGYTVRWGMTTTSFFPRRVIEKHGLVPRGRGVLSVVVLKDQGDQSTPKPVEAEMSAHATNRLGQRRDIVMRPVTEDGLTS